jgi:hypothetical protein
MKIIKLIGLLVLIYVGYFFYSWKSSVEEIKVVCSEIEKGQNKQEVIDIIESSKYLRHIQSSDKKNNKQYLIILSNANMGRYTCMVEHDGKVVIKSDFTHSD